jgi:hypothetical protein
MPSIIWEILGIFTTIKVQNVVQGSQIYHLFLLRDIFQNCGDYQDGVW